MGVEANLGRWCRSAGARLGGMRRGDETALHDRIAGAARVRAVASIPTDVEIWTATQLSERVRRLRGMLREGRSVGISLELIPVAIIEPTSPE